MIFNLRNKSEIDSQQRILAISKWKSESVKVITLICIYRWYFRKIKRIEAEKKLLLPENDHGAFLIRDSESRHNDYSLSGNVIER